MLKNNHPILSIQYLSSGYDNNRYVSKINLDIYEGEFCALLGLNGSGKTTLLKALCGLLPVSSGSFFSHGKDITHLNEKNRAEYISYIPQRYTDLIGVTVFEVVLMGLNSKLGFFESPSYWDKDFAKRVLEKMQILHLANEDFSKLSEGQKQKVILSRALVQNAPIMLMDEPDSALDFTGKHQILAKIRSIVHSNEKAGLVTLHDPNLALTHCDRLILLDEGQIKAQIDMNTANKTEIRQKLSLIYDNIKISTLSGKFTVQMKVK
jgi:iron complex transport system ATP-binding protein